MSPADRVEDRVLAEVVHERCEALRFCEPGTRDDHDQRRTPRPAARRRTLEATALEEEGP